MSKHRTVSGGYIPIAGLLGVAFVVLKLLEEITWPWIWVLSPFWIPLAILLGVLIIICIVALVYWLATR